MGSAVLSQYLLGQTWWGITMAVIIARIEDGTAVYVIDYVRILRCAITAHRES